jgi:hypothetical protein
MTEEQLRCIAIIYRLPKYQAKLLGLLVEAPTADHTMVQEITSHLKTPARLDILKLRRHLLLSKVRIYSQFNLGWYLDDKTKERILEEIEEHMHFIRGSHERNNIRHREAEETIQLELLPAKELRDMPTSASANRPAQELQGGVQ